MVYCLPFAWHFTGRFHAGRAKGHHEPQPPCWSPPPCPPFTFWADFFFFFSFVQSSQLTFPRLAEDRMKPSGLSAAQMCQNVFAECSVTMHYSWKVFLNMCPFPESCLAVSLGTFPNVCCSWKYCTMLRVASYLWSFLCLFAGTFPFTGIFNGRRLMTMA